MAALGCRRSSNNETAVRMMGAKGAAAAQRRVDRRLREGSKDKIISLLSLPKTHKGIDREEIRDI
jgi:hypothetical protein